MKIIIKTDFKGEKMEKRYWLFIMIFLFVNIAKTFGQNYCQNVSDLQRSKNNDQTCVLPSYDMHGYDILREYQSNDYRTRGGLISFPVITDFLAGINLYFIEERLMLTERQQKEVRNITSAYLNDASALNMSLRRTKTELSSILGKDNIDVAKAKKLYREIDDMQMFLGQKGVEAFLKAKKILTKDQIELMNFLNGVYYKNAG